MQQAVVVDGYFALLTYAFPSFAPVYLLVLSPRLLLGSMPVDTRFIRCYMLL
jgi:hypothetical protein